MEQNEAKTLQDDTFRELCKILRPLVVNREQIMANDQRFNDFLVEAVRQGELRSTYAIYCYCRRHDISEFNLVNLKMQDGEPRAPILDFLDAIVSGEDLSGLFYVMDNERLEGRL